MISARDLKVEMDYGQFALMSDWEDVERLPEAIDAAFEADGVAQLGGLLVLVTPNQWNFELPLRVEVWDEAPVDDLEEWQHAYEAHVEVADELWWDSPTTVAQDLQVPPGAYRVLITGRGFTAFGDTEPEPATDHWRLRLSPSNGPTAPRRLLHFIA
ncbi:MAG: hypothetical protein QOI76_1535 [Frankiales bacterium]|nr:hypothetical protein [Frankiales bacterium]MDX6256182.1 hypothetical protein [Frankiales bacterium]